MGDQGNHKPGPWVEGEASDLRSRLRELASSVDPFPSFWGAGSIQALELEPDSPEAPYRGCVVVCPDGDLYELVLRMIPGPVDVGGLDQVQELRPLDLPPAEYAAYARAAVRELTAILEERGP